MNVLRNSTASQIEYPGDTYRNGINKEIESISTDLAQFKLLGFTDDNTKMDAIMDELFVTLKDSTVSITQIQNNTFPKNDTKTLYKANYQKSDNNFTNAISTAVSKNKADAEKLFVQNQTCNFSISTTASPTKMPSFRYSLRIGLIS